MLSTRGFRHTLAPVFRSTIQPRVTIHSRPTIIFPQFLGSSPNTKPSTLSKATKPCTKACTKAKSCPKSIFFEPSIKVTFKSRINNAAAKLEAAAHHLYSSHGPEKYSFETCKLAAKAVTAVPIVLSCWVILWSGVAGWYILCGYTAEEELDASWRYLVESGTFRFY